MAFLSALRFGYKNPQTVWLGGCLSCCPFVYGNMRVLRNSGGAILGASIKLQIPVNSYICHGDFSIVKEPINMVTNQLGIPPRHKKLVGNVKCNHKSCQ